MATRRPLNAKIDSCLDMDAMHCVCTKERDGDTEKTLVMFKGRICWDNVRVSTLRQTLKINVIATKSMYRATGPTSSSTDPVALDTWQTSHQSAVGKSLAGCQRRKRESNPSSAALLADSLITRPHRHSTEKKRQ